MVDSPKMEWKESVNLVFDYFCERTPRSFVETRQTSMVWNYKYAGTPPSNLILSCRLVCCPRKIASRAAIRAQAWGPAYLHLV